MSQSLGSASLFLSANSTGLDKGLADASAKTTGWITRINSSMSMISASPLVGAVLTAGRALQGILTETVDKLDNASKTAKSLGIGVEQFTALQYSALQANLETEDLTKGLKKLSETLGSAQLSPDGEAARSLAQLGLHAEELVGIPLDQALGKVADKIGLIDDPMVRGTIASNLFGKAWVKLIPLLLDGSAGLAMTAKEAKALGVTITDLDAKNIDALDNASKRLGATWEGLKNKGTLWAGKVLEGLQEASQATTEKAMRGSPLAAIPAAWSWLAKKLGGSGGAGKEAGGPTPVTVDPVFEALVNGISDVEKELKKSIATMGMSAEEIKVYALAEQGATSEMLESVRALSLQKDIMSELEKPLEKAIATWGMSAEEISLWTLAQRGATEEQLASARALLLQKASMDEAQKETEELTALSQELTQSIDTFRLGTAMTSEELRIWKLAQEGLSGEVLDTITALAKQKKLLDDTKAIIDASESPLEKWEKKQDTLGEALKQGIINWEAYALAVSKANEELISASNVSDVKSPQAIVEGSREAASLILRANQQTDLNDPGAKLQRAINEQINIQRQQLDVQRKLLQSAQADVVEEVI